MNKCFLAIAFIANVLVNCGASADPVQVASSSTNEIEYKLGVEAYNKKDWSTAITDLTAAIGINPTNVSAHLRRGEAYALSSNFDKAMSDFDEVVRLDPTNAMAYFDRGNIYRILHESEKAIAEYDASLRFNATNYLAYESRAASYVSEGEIEKAMKDWNEGLRLNPKDALALAGRGWAYFKASDYGNAVRDYKAAIQLDPANAWAYNGLAWLRATSPKAQIRDGIEAIKDATKACELAKWAQPEYVDTLAAAYAETEDFDDAVKYQLYALSMSGVDKEKLLGMRRHLCLYEQQKPNHNG